MTLRCFTSTPNEKIQDKIESSQNNNNEDKVSSTPSATISDTDDTSTTPVPAVSQSKKVLEVPSVICVEIEKRTEQDWQILADYFSNLVYDPQDPIISRIRYDDWLTVTQYWSRQKTVEGLNTALRVFGRLVEHLQVPLHVRDGTTSASYHQPMTPVLNRILIKWKTLFQSEMKPKSGDKKNSLSLLGMQESWEPKERDHKNDDSRLPGLYELLDIIDTWRKHGMPVSLFAYNKLILKSCLDACSTNDQRLNLPLFCENVVEHMVKYLYTTTNESKQKRKEGRSGNDYDDEDGDDDDIARPDLETFSLVLKAWARSNRPDAMERAMQVLKQMDHLSSFGIVNCKPDTNMYNTCLQILVRQKDPEKMKFAEEIFQDMDKGQLDSTVAPNFVSYRIMFYGMVNLLEVDHSDYSCSRVEVFLRNMELVERQHMILDNDPNHPNRPRLHSSMYGYLIMMLARLKKFDEAERVFNMLVEMGKSYPNQPRFAPDHHTKRAMLFVQAGRGEAEEAEKLLMDLEKDAEHEDGEHSATRAHYEAVIDCWLRNKTVHDSNSTLSAATWLLRMLELAPKRKDLVPSPVLANAVLFRVASRMEEGPDQILARESPLEAENLLRLLRNTELQLQPPEPLVYHDSYKRVIHAWGRRALHPGAPQRAEALLLEMQRRSERGERFVAPTVDVYTGVMTVWFRSRLAGSLKHAEEVFLEGYEQYLAGNIDAAPDRICYGFLITACASAGDMKRMERYVDMMIKDVTERGNQKARPTTKTLVSVLVGCLKSKKTSPETALRVAQKMNDIGAQFDDRTNSMLHELKNLPAKRRLATRAD